MSTTSPVSDYQGAGNLEVPYSMATEFDLDFWPLLLWQGLLYIVATNGVNESTLPYLTGKQKVTHGKGVVAKIASQICTRTW